MMSQTQPIDPSSSSSDRNTRIGSKTLHDMIETECALHNFFPEETRDFLTVFYQNTSQYDSIRFERHFERGNYYEVMQWVVDKMEAVAIGMKWPKGDVWSREARESRKGEALRARMAELPG